MVIVFKDVNTVEVDGINAGDIVSVLSNYPNRKKEILDAFNDFRKSENDDKAAAIAAAFASASADIAAKEIEHAAAIEAKDSEHQIDRGKLDAIMTELGGEEAVAVKLKAERLARIEAEKQRLAEEEAELKK